MKDITKRVLTVVIGSIMMGLGITLYLNAGLGVDPLGTFVSALAKVTDLSYGLASQSWMAVLIVVVFFLERKRLGMGTVINALLIGWCVDLFMGLGILQPEAMFMRVVTLLFGAIIMAMGIGVYVSGRLGEGASEALMVILQHRTKIDLRWVKIGMDVVLLTIGIILGGQFGIGTVIGVIVTGPIVEKTIIFLQKSQWIGYNEVLNGNS